MDFLSSNHNSKNEKPNDNNKRYRNMAPVFAIDEDDNNQDSEGIVLYSLFKTYY